MEMITLSIILQGKTTMFNKHFCSVFGLMPDDVAL